MKIDVNNLDWEQFEELPPKEKIKRKKLDFEQEKEKKSKKSNTYKKDRRLDENI